jgi:malate dehydrogenase (quinone)
MQEPKIGNSKEQDNEFRLSKELIGKLEFGTEIINTHDGSLAVLLGASPGASTAVSIMVELVSKCFSEQFNSSEWQEKVKAMIPSFGQALNENPELLATLRSNTAEVLKLVN